MPLQAPSFFDAGHYLSTASLFQGDIGVLREHLSGGPSSNPLSSSHLSSRAVDFREVSLADCVGGPPTPVVQTGIWRDYQALYGGDLSSNAAFMGMEFDVTSEAIAALDAKDPASHNAINLLYGALRLSPFMNLDLFPTGLLRFKALPVLTPGKVTLPPPLFLLSLPILVGGRHAMAWEVIDQEIPLKQEPGAFEKPGREGIRERVKRDAWPLLRLRSDDPEGDKEPKAGTNFHTMKGLLRAGAILHDLSHVSSWSWWTHGDRRRIPIFYDCVEAATAGILTGFALEETLDIVFFGPFLGSMNDRKGTAGIPASDDPFEGKVAQIALTAGGDMARLLDPLSREVETRFAHDPEAKTGFQRALSRFVPGTRVTI